MTVHPSISQSVLPVRADRQAIRAIAQIRAGTNVELYAHAAQRQIEVAKMHTIAEVAEAGLIATAHLSVVEAVLAQQAPHAEARLRCVADGASAAIAHQVMTLGRRLS